MKVGFTLSALPTSQPYNGMFTVPNRAGASLAAAVAPLIAPALEITDKNHKSVQSRGCAPSLARARLSSGGAVRTAIIPTQECIYVGSWTWPFGGSANTNINASRYPFNFSGAKSPPNDWITDDYKIERTW